MIIPIDSKIFQDGVARPNQQADIAIKLSSQTRQVDRCCWPSVALRCRCEASGIPGMISVVRWIQFESELMMAIVMEDEDKSWCLWI